MDVNDYNRRAWDASVKSDNRWTKPVDADTVASARKGIWEIYLTPKTPVPGDWFRGIGDRESVAGCRILCLAGSGGQQAPILAAAGGQVTVFDQSGEQLKQDRAVADREQLTIETIQGDMADLTELADESFDLIVNPTSTCFVPDIHPVWRECFRVLRSGGRMMSGFCMPSMYIFDRDRVDQGELVVRFKLPYSDVEHLTDREKQAMIDDQEPFEFSHSLDAQLGVPLQIGFHLIGFFEDGWDVPDVLTDHYPPFASFLAWKPEKNRLR